MVAAFNGYAEKQQIICLIKPNNDLKISFIDNFYEPLPDATNLILMALPENIF